MHALLGLCARVLSTSLPRRPPLKTVCAKPKSARAPAGLAPQAQLVSHTTPPSVRRAIRVGIRAETAAGRVNQAGTKAKMQQRNTSARRAARANTPPQAHRPRVINRVQLGNIRAKMKRRNTNARCVSKVSLRLKQAKVHVGRAARGNMPPRQQLIHAKSVKQENIRMKRMHQTKNASVDKKEK